MKPAERSDAIAISRAGGTAKNPEGLTGGVALAGINVDKQLRLALFDGNKKKRNDSQRC